MTDAGLDPVSLLAHVELLAATNMFARPATVKAIVAALRTEIAEATVAIRPTERGVHGIVWDAHSLFHEELGWYATADDRVLGVVVEDKRDRDFGYVVLMRNPGDGLFRALDLKVSLPSEEAATCALLTAMREWAPHEAVTADFE
jgi:hypothetical protein